MKHWRYLTYVLRHKWFVFVAGLKRGVPIGQLIVHDWSKFLPSEWWPYADYFYGHDGGSWAPVLAMAKAATGTKVEPERRALYEEAYRRFDAFMLAFVKHLHRNPHHWEHWVLSGKDASRPPKVFQISERYRREMLADWDGAGRAITGTWDTPTWYAKNRDSQVMHHATRALVDRDCGYRDTVGLRAEETT